MNRAKDTIILHTLIYVQQIPLKLQNHVSFYVSMIHLVHFWQQCFNLSLVKPVIRLLSSTGLGPRQTCFERLAPHLKLTLGHPLLPSLKINIFVTIPQIIEQV